MEGRRQNDSRMFCERKVHQEGFTKFKHKEEAVTTGPEQPGCKGAPAPGKRRFECAASGEAEKGSVGGGAAVMRQQVQPLPEMPASKLSASP